MTARPLRVAVLGGGMGALSAAYDLSRVPGSEQRFEITVYQMGWRLGGKGASGRDAERGQRIEEHGLHVWAGYYDNAFELIRDCYAALGRRPGQPLATWQEAFRKRSFFSLHELVDGRWRPWNIRMPENDLVPGEGDGDLAPAEIARMLARALRELASRAHLSSAEPGEAEPQGVRERIGRLRRRGADAVRRHRILRDFIGAHLRGVVADGVVRRGPAAVDDQEWSEWLRRHGARDETLASPLVRCVYDTVFAYVGGDTRRPRISAGRVLYVLSRFLFRYKGALFWEMHGGGMGDVVFAPLYEVLRRRGVRFELFHFVEGLGLDAEGQNVESVRLLRQAALAEGVDEYRPLIDVGGLPCWPSQPRWEQLENGAALRESGVDFEAFEPLAWPGARARTLRRGEDFDVVVLGIPVGALGRVCGELVAARREWRDMVERVPTVGTLAAQLWLRRDARSMGWTAPRTILCAGPQPFNTWADMSHLLASERWPEGSVRQLAYFCGPLQDAGAAVTGEAARREHGVAVAAGARAWLAEYAAGIWPNSTRDGRGLDPAELHGGDEGGDPFAAQHFRANVGPSERYVLSTPESLPYRLAPDASGFDNLALAGDWVATPYNLGTIEAATIGGRLAARAVSGHALRIFGEEHLARPVRTLAAARAAALPRHVERCGDVVFRHPTVVRGGDLYTFAVPASREALQAALDRDLNAVLGGRGRFEAGAPLVWLCCADLPCVASDHPLDRSAGTVHEREITLFVPVVLRPGSGAARAGLYPLIMFVDHPWAVAAGREIFGFPKNQAAIDLKSDERGLRCVRVAAPVLERFAPGSAAVERPVIEVERLDDEPPRLLDGLADLGRHLSAQLDAAAWPALLRSAARREVPLFFLKQFRDIGDPDRSSYQAVVEAVTRVDRTHALAAERTRFRITLRSWASHPLAREIGLGAGGATLRADTFEAALGYRVTLDFTIQRGHEIGRGDRP